LERRLKCKAAHQGRTPSELVRSLIEREIEGAEEPVSTLYERAAAIIEKLVGDPTLPSGEDARAALESWNPDRRG